MAIKLDNHLIEYKVRPVTRYVVTRFEGYDLANGGNCAGSDGKGEFDSFDTAYQVGYTLCRDEHQRLGWPLDDDRIKYPEPPTPPNDAVQVEPHLVPPRMARAADNGR